MQAIISARGLSISKTYKDTLTQRLAKLEPMFPGIVEAKIVLSKEKHRRTAALTLVAKRHTFRSEETAADLETAVDVAVDALARQVREMKDRVKNRKARSAPRRAPAPVRAGASQTGARSPSGACPSSRCRWRRPSSSSVPAATSSSSSPMPPPTSSASSIGEGTAASD